MTDIVEKLRGSAESGLPADWIRMVADAADEIERLRGLLRHVIDNPWDYDANRVREALGDE